MPFVSKSFASKSLASLSRFGLAPLFAILVLSVFTCLTQSTALGQVTGKEVDFANDVKPIFEKHCLRCHGAEEQDGDFRIDDGDRVSDYIDAGEAEFSDLIGMLTAESDDYEQMPPLDDGGPLSKENIQVIRLWINQGADWPENIELATKEGEAPRGEATKGNAFQLPSDDDQKELEQEINEKMAEKDAQESPWQLLWEIAGLLHPVVLHFPVALLIGGAMFALFGFRGESPMSDAAYYCLWLAALTGILACVSGWSFAIYKGYLDWNSFDIPKTSIDVHRWGGILVAVLTFLLALVASGSRRRDPYGTGAFWKLSLMLLAVLTGYVAHHGGKLTHKGLHEDLNSKAQTLYSNIAGENEEAADENKAEGDKAEGDGKTSAEQPDDKKTSDKAGEKADDKKPADADKGSVESSGGKAIEADGNQP